MKVEIWIGTVRRMFAWRIYGQVFLKPPLRHVSYMTEKIHEDKALRRTWLDNKKLFRFSTTFRHFTLFCFYNFTFPKVFLQCIHDSKYENSYKIVCQVCYILVFRVQCHVEISCCAETFLWKLNKSLFKIHHQPNGMII